LLSDFQAGTLTKRLSSIRRFVIGFNGLEVLPVNLHSFLRIGGVLLAKVFSSAVLGIDAYRVEVEVDITSGLPTYTIMRSPDEADQPLCNDDT
jgi:hypothetical protein